MNIGLASNPGNEYKPKHGAVLSPPSKGDLGGCFSCVGSTSPRHAYSVAAPLQRQEGRTESAVGYGAVVYIPRPFGPPPSKGDWGRRMVWSWRDVFSPGDSCPLRLEKQTNNSPIFIIIHKDAPVFAVLSRGMPRDLLRSAWRCNGILMRLPCRGRVYS
jgi:hypothetical protein